MRPNPLLVIPDNMVWREVDKKSVKTKFDEISDKEYLFRLVSLTQSIRSILLFFVWVAVIEIIGGIYIVLKLLN